MGKEEIFSKLNIRDYSNQLEKIIAKKAFSEDTKNLLLNMLYKIEVAYDDYNQVKVETKFKKDILEDVVNIIEKKCNRIDLVSPRLEEKEILKRRKSIGIRKEKRIITYPKEKAVMYALYSLKDRSFRLDKNNTIFQNSLRIFIKYWTKH